MKHLFLSLSLLSAAVLLGAAENNEVSIRLPKIVIGTAGKNIGLAHFPICVPFNQDLRVFDGRPSHLTGNFYTNSEEAADFIRKNFISIFQTFKDPREISTFSAKLEKSFNAVLSKEHGIHKHARIIKESAVIFNLLHILANDYSNIVGAPYPKTSVFAPASFNGANGGSPYYPYDFLTSNLCVLHPFATSREEYAIAGALQAGATPDSAAELALETISLFQPRTYLSAHHNKEILSFVQLELDPKESTE